MSKRVVVCGSRGYGRLDVVRKRTREFGPDTVLIVGGARGPDQAAERAGYEVGMDVRVFLPDWKTFPRSAGHRRNGDMLKELQAGPPNVERTVVAFFDGSSRGTAGMIREAHRRGVDCEVWGVDGARER